MTYAISLSGITALVHFRYGEVTQFYLKGNNFGTVTSVAISAEGVAWHVDFDPTTDIITPGQLIRVRTIPRPGGVADLGKGVHRPAGAAESAPVGVPKDPFRSADLTITLTNAEGIPVPVAMVLGEPVEDAALFAS